MRRIEYKDLSPELKALVNQMEKDLNNEKNQDKSSKPFSLVLTKQLLYNDPPSADDTKLEFDVAVFHVDKSKEDYIFSHIETRLC